MKTLALVGETISHNHFDETRALAVVLNVDIVEFVKAFSPNSDVRQKTADIMQKAVTSMTVRDLRDVIAFENSRVNWAAV